MTEDCDPSARRGREASISDRAALAATMLVITGLLVAALAQGRDPWLDESALITNLLTDNVRSLLEPMRYFEQATTLVHRILGMWIAQDFQTQAGIYAAVMALRVLSAVAALLMAFWVFKTVRLFGGPMEAVTAAIMVTVSSFAIRYATETKHYVFEAAASAAVWYTAALLSESPRSSARQWMLLATALVGYAFSFTLLLVVIACSVGVVSVALLKDLPATRATQASRFAGSKLMLLVYWNRSLLLVCFVACVAGVCVYVFYSVPVTVFQFAANPDHYGSGGIGKSLLIGVLTTPVNLARYLYSVLAPFQGWRVFVGNLSGHILTFVFGVLLLACLLALKRNPFISISAVALYAVVGVLHLLSIFPFIGERHFYFMLPMFAGMLVLGAGEGLLRLQKRAGSRLGRIAPISFALLTGLYVAGGIGALKGLKVEEVSPLLKHVDAVSPDTPIWVYYGAQPAISVLARPRLIELGLLDHRSSSVGWEIKTGARDPHNIRATRREYIRLATEVISAQDDVWLLFAHDRGGDRDAIVSGVKSNAHRCNLDAQAPGVHLYRCQVARVSHK